MCHVHAPRTLYLRGGVHNGTMQKEHSAQGSFMNAIEGTFLIGIDGTFMNGMDECTRHIHDWNRRHRLTLSLCLCDVSRMHTVMPHTCVSAIYTSIHTSMSCTCVCMYEFLYINVCIYIYMYVCICVCITLTIPLSLSIHRFLCLCFVFLLSRCQSIHTTKITKVSDDVRTWQQQSANGSGAWGWSGKKTLALPSNLPLLFHSLLWINEIIHLTRTWSIYILQNTNCAYIQNPVMIDISLLHDKICFSTKIGWRSGSGGAGCEGQAIHSCPP